MRTLHPEAFAPKFSTLSSFPCEGSERSVGSALYKGVIHKGHIKESRPVLRTVGIPSSGLRRPFFILASRPLGFRAQVGGTGHGQLEVACTGNSWQSVRACHRLHSGLFNPSGYMDREPQMRESILIPSECESF